MKKSLLIGLCFAFLYACGGSGGGNHAPPVVNPPVAGPTPAELLAADLQGLSLDDLFSQSFQALITRSPETIDLAIADQRLPTRCG